MLEVMKNLPDFQQFCREKCSDIVGFCKPQQLLPFLEEVIRLVFPPRLQVQTFNK